MEIEFVNISKDLIYPVFSEIYVKELLNREEFRDLFDKTYSEILDTIENLYEHFLS